MIFIFHGVEEERISKATILAKIGTRECWKITKNMIWYLTMQDLVAHIGVVDIEKGQGHLLSQEQEAAAIGKKK
jgi:hypothetical protein